MMMLLMYTLASRQPDRCSQKSRRRSARWPILVDRCWTEAAPHRVPGTAVFLTSDPARAPTALLHSLKHYKVLHEKNVILTIDTAPTPRVDPTTTGCIIEADQPQLSPG